MATPRKTEVIADLYNSLVSDPELPAPLQWRIYRYAVRNRKYSLMARLCALPSLAPDLDRVLFERTESKVRAAWVARPGRSTAAVLEVLDGARKGPVYTAAAAVPGLPVDIYTKLADDGRLDTARELLGNPDVPLRVKMTAAATYGRGYRDPKNTYRTKRDLEDLFSDQLGLLPLVLAETEQVAMIAWAVKQVAFSAPLVERLVKVVAVHLRGSTADYYAATAIMESGAGLFGQPALSHTGREDLADACQIWQARNEQWSRGYWMGEFTRAQNAGPVNLPEASHPQTELVRSATTSQELAEAKAVVVGSGDAELAIALACNQAADIDIVAAVLPHIPTPLVARVAQVRARNLPVLAHLVANCERDILTDELLALSGQPSQALVAVARAYRVSGKKISVRLGRSEYVTPSVMGALPLSLTSKKGSMLARRAVGDLLAEALTGDRDWEMFETLGANFDGPLENLLLACGYIAAPAEGDLADVEDSTEPAEPTGSEAATIDPDGIATWSLF